MKLAFLHARVLAVPCALAALAILVRVYNIELTGTVPDTYERLFDARRIAAGEFPASTIYPPGAAFLIAPFFLVLPETLATMQAVIIGSGVALVIAGYVWVVQLTRDRLAASMLGVALAICPLLVYASRVAYFDTLNVLLIVVLLAVLPWLRGRNLGWFVAYGVLLAILVNIRPTNAALLPAIAFLWLSVNGTEFRLSSILKNSVTASTIVAAGTFLLLCGASIVLGEWFSQSSGSPGLTFGEFLPNLLFYEVMVWSGWVGLTLIAPFSLVGLVKLWHLNKPYGIVFLYLVLVWPVVHSPFDFTNYRYILPILFLLLLLASVGLSTILRNPGQTRRPSRLAIIGLTQLAVLLISLHFALGSGDIIAKWSQKASEYDGALARELLPAVEQLEDGSTLIGAVDRVFRDSEETRSLGLLDLVDHHRVWGTGEDSLDRLRAGVREDLDDGRKVYYLYSHWEAGDDFLGDGKEHYKSFFQGLNEEFLMTERLRTTLKRSGRHPWILYEVARP